MIDYETTYEMLYQKGYHEKWRDVTHAHGRLWPWCLENLEFASMLDVGASYGALVETAAKAGKEATGLEVSPTACCGAAVLNRNVRLGSMLRMPFPARAFDLVISSDTFEHLQTQDVRTAIDECVRVSKRYLAMKISMRMDRGLKWKRLVGHDLHLTMRNHDTWLGWFIQAAVDRKPRVVKNFDNGMFVLELRA